MKTQNSKAHSKHPLSTAIEFAGLGDWFEVFIGGTQTDSQGREKTWTDAELDSVVANHTVPAPLVIGHPKTNSPAYGWTEALKREGDKLFAKAKDYAPEFETAVKNKHYPQRSISLAPDGNGGFKLRHIGFLGGVAPAVEGLQGIEFETATDDALCFEFSMAEELRELPWVLRSVQKMFRGLREHLINTTDLETANSVLPDYNIDSLGETATALQNATSANQFTAPALPDQEGQVLPMTDKTFTQADIDAAVAQAKADATADVAQREAELKFNAAKSQATTTIEKLVEQGRLLPAQTEGLAEFMAGLATEDDSQFEFAAADNTTAKKTPAQFMTDFMANLGKQIEFGQNGTQPPDAKTKPSTEYHGHAVSEESAQLDAAARDYMAKHEGVDYIQALKAVEGK